MKRLLLICLALWSVTALAQRTGVREEVLADWNKCSGLDCLYDFSPKASTPVPKGYEAVYISHYGRHGSRYAYTEKAYTIFLNLLSEGRRQDNLTPYGEALLNKLEPFWDNVKYRVGDLTPLGWEQHQYIGRTMVKSFPTAFGKGSVVDACSSGSTRSIVSMGSCCAAISREAPLASVYGHQSKLDIQATRPNEGPNPFKYTGPANVFPYPESSEDFFLRRFPGYRDVLARVFKDPDSCLGRYNPYRVFFHLYMLIAGMNSLPEDIRVDISDLVTPQEYATLWECDNYERLREYIAYRTPCSSIVDDIIAKADEALASGTRGAHLRFGHDHVAMALFMIMDIDGFDHFPSDPDDLVYWFQTFRARMATNIQLVFFAPKKNRKGDVLVKLLLNGEEARLGDLEPYSGPYYRWSDARSYLAQRANRFVTRPPENEWTATDVAPGIVYRSYVGVDPVSGRAQKVFVADWDMSSPGYALKFNTTADAVVTSRAMESSGAVVAMNACYEPASVVIKADGKYISDIPNNTIMDSGVPNWKNEGAIYTDGGRNVSISYDSRGRDLAQLRKFYKSSTAPNIFSSAPMLIDDYVPVGKSFAGYYNGDALKEFNYEDSRRHQGVRHPRTAVAITADNHLLMVVVDGRRPGVSEGMTCRELTEFLRQNFNPRYALNMDGGGSSTLCISGQGDPATHVVNYPSGSRRYDHSGERRLFTHFVLVKEQ
ncbi:MAG: phosphodiester glycosidase family protein [Bacteroidales bacterium]|nr:phosphodiester glycosidase family protein [Bacteroidales bacterium]